MTQEQSPLTILLVDDDKTIVDIFKYGLSEHGYEVHTAFTVSEALRVANAIRIDCLLSDIQLPGRDGITLNAIIREMYPDVISILMTGYPGISSAIKGLRQNIHDYLIKPFSVEQVIASIERAIKNDNLQKTNVSCLQKISELEEELEALKKQLSEIDSKGKDESQELIRKTVDHARAHKSYLEQQGRLKQ
ncbi:MAG: response regulator [Candidatus Marinimicrobia bacterium]|nr:response regulator [Candidatus Neomarinimicrobiota bacterium]